MFKASRLFKSSVVAFGLSATLMAAGVDKIHFLIPGGAGGGWDGTARGVGEALTKSGLVDEASYQNMSGGGGGKAIAYLIKTAKKQKNTMMVNSTPIITRSLQKVFPQSYRDLTLISAVIADFGVLVVRSDGKYKNWQDVAKAFEQNPRKIKIAGGSTKGSTDHLVAANIFRGIGANPRAVRYIPYDAGGKALAGLLTGEADILSTGLSEALEQHRKGEIKIIGVTSEKGIEGIPSFKEMGVDVYFANWRGFFGAPGLSKKRVNELVETLEAMYETSQWEEVRKRNGWVNVFKPKGEFKSFLEEQEKSLGSLMRELGFLR